MSATETPTNGKAERLTPAKRIKAIEDFVAANALKSETKEEDPLDALMAFALQAKAELPKLRRSVEELEAELDQEDEFPVETFDRTAAAALRRPFTPQAVKFKVQATWDGGALIVAYIDARLVIERLNLVCPHLWNAEYRLQSGNQMWCDLTVDGITRTDIGEGTGKGLVSDALKRAGVHFGIGVSLYAIPKIRLRKQDGHLADARSNNGETYKLTPNGETRCLDIYTAWLESKGTKAFGEPLDHGDTDEAAGDLAVDEAAPQPQQANGQQREPVKPPEDHIAALLAQEGPLQALRQQADAGMQRLGAKPGQRLRELTANTTEAALQAVLARIEQALPQEQSGEPEPEPPTDARGVPADTTDLPPAEPVPATPPDDGAVTASGDPIEF